MKKIFIGVLGLGILISCDNKQVKKNTSTIESEQTEKVVQNEIHRELYGNWVGDFVLDDEVAEQIAGENSDAEYDYNPKINLSIKRITKDTVIAQNIVRGTQRPMMGRMEENGSQISFILDEPGDNKSDGRFEFKLNKDTLEGTWVAFDQSVRIKKRNFKLLKKQFVYNANLMLTDYGEGEPLVDWRNGKNEEITENDGDTTYTYISRLYRAASPAVFKLNGSKVKLTEVELKNLKKLDLEIIRNSIFARHGYAFSKISIRQFFDPVDWYVPISKDVTNELTQLEKDNISILQRFEKYATDNYDQFGR